MCGKQLQIVAQLQDFSVCIKQNLQVINNEIVLILLQMLQRMNANSLFAYSQRMNCCNREQLLQGSLEKPDQQIKCRICYETKKPLVSVCACFGSIQYVHEECIIDWIAKKFQAADTLQIPNCEICHQKFSAQLRIGKEKVCYRILLSKLASTSKKQLFQIIFHMIILIFSIFTIFMAAQTALTCYWREDSTNLSTSYTFSSLGEVMKFNFTNIIIQIYGIFYFFSFLSTKKKWIKQSMVHIVQVLLVPKRIYK